ncbi:hypothetical protein Q3G72_011931 [Acer saccharum]|nr:hypothetical protein Q3G72_011931 [Acer saccharum]
MVGFHIENVDQIESVNLSTNMTYNVGDDDTEMEEADVKFAEEMVKPSDINWVDMTHNVVVSDVGGNAVEMAKTTDVNFDDEVEEPSTDVVTAVIEADVVMADASYPVKIESVNLSTGMTHNVGDGNTEMAEADVKFAEEVVEPSDVNWVDMTHNVIVSDVGGGAAKMAKTTDVNFANESR